MALPWLVLCSIVTGSGSQEPQDVGLHSLKPSTFVYISEKLLGNAEVMSEKIGELLIHQEAVQVLETSSKLLHRPPKKKKWALYNPSILQMSWHGEPSFLITYRAGTWQLCHWTGHNSPLASLPEVDGRRQATSKVMAAIVRRDFSILVPVHELEDQKYLEHSCIHSTGMRRVGIDDSRLFLLGGDPFALFAGVAPAGQDYPCQHRQYLCPLQLPEEGSKAKVRCRKKTMLTFEYADELSERMLRQDRLGNIHQKNWMPFVASGELYLIFTIEPLRVLHVDMKTGHCKEVSMVRTTALRALNPKEDEFRGHGGPALVPLPGGELLGMARVQSGNLLYSHFFFTLRVSDAPSSSAPVTLSSVSRLLCFGSGRPGLCEVIQFVGGLHIDKEQLVITYGVNDCEPKVTVMALGEVLKLLTRTGADSVEL